MRQIVRVKRVLQIISNIKIIRHDQKISNIDFSILEILQSWLRRIRINVHHIENVVIVEEQNKWNVSVTKKVFTK